MNTPKESLTIASTKFKSNFSYAESRSNFSQSELGKMNTHFNNYTPDQIVEANEQDEMQSPQKVKKQQSEKDDEKSIFSSFDLKAQTINLRDDSS